MFGNVSSITEQIGNIIVKKFNEILPKMQIVSSGYEPSIYTLLTCIRRLMWELGLIERTAHFQLSYTRLI